MMPLLLAALVAVTFLQSPRTPQATVDELLAADRGFAAQAAKTTVVPALVAMYAEDVTVPVSVPAPGFARGKQQAIDALKANPDNAQSRLEWAPIRGGVSSDGEHGFTVGYMTLHKPDGAEVPMKYVAYWIKRPEGWRVAVYKRVPVEKPPTSREMLAPALPSSTVPAITDAAAIARHKSSLEAAEKAFSDEAQTIGLGPAFAKHGSEDAVNVGPPTSPTFVVSAAQIGKTIGTGTKGKPSPVSWAADEGSLVASSGDLGVTFGYIRQNTPPPPGRPAAVPFITIWRRPNPNAPWRYVAE